jgi:hypothetical protein
MNTVLMSALLLALTALFNLAEMALVAARASALHGAENGKAAGNVLHLKKRPGLFLAAIRAGDLITDLLTGAFIVSWIEALIRTGLGALPVIGGYASAVAGLGAFAIVSYLILVFADLAPKSIALSAPERSAMLISSPLRLLIVVARPFLAVLEGSNGRPDRTGQGRRAGGDCALRLHLGGGTCPADVLSAHLGIGEELNRSLGTPVVETAAGGSGDGGAVLTRAGKAVIERYRAIEVDTASSRESICRRFIVPVARSDA